MDVVSDRRSGDERIAAVASLDQPVRRRLHALLAAGASWISRDAAAASLGVARSVAAFHLDKLADAGVVDVAYERTTGRTGPGAGRTSKLYRLVDHEISASVPDRRYDLAAQLLADAVARSVAGGEPVEGELAAAAREHGARIARAERADEADDGALGVLEVLDRCGYEPCTLEDGTIALRNCPFHRLAEDHRALVCGMNLDLLGGLVDALEPDPELRVELRPEPGWCCVRLPRA
jgi:predicted ArsR family transcriptional regulator